MTREAIRRYRRLVRVVVLGLAVLLASAACTRRYYVRPSHLTRAQTVPDAVLPALDDDRAPTFIEARRVRRMGLLDPATGLQEVRASDARNFLRVTGWIPTGLAVIFATIALPAVAEDGFDDTDSIGFVFTIEAAVHFAIGLPFLVLGYLNGGAEADGPSPGMPATLAEP
jgi:hypothetical protein